MRQLEGGAGQKTSVKRDRRHTTALADGSPLWKLLPPLSPTRSLFIFDSSSVSHGWKWGEVITTLMTMARKFFLLPLFNISYPVSYHGTRTETVMSRIGQKSSENCCFPNLFQTHFFPPIFFLFGKLKGQKLEASLIKGAHIHKQQALSHTLLPLLNFRAWSHRESSLSGCNYTWVNTIQIGAKSKDSTY